MKKLIWFLVLAVLLAVAWLAWPMIAKAQVAEPAQVPTSLQPYLSDETKVVWGGGEIANSTYSRVMVPVVIDQLAKERLAGYQWGGPSAGTIENAIRVTLNPTHVALGQADILSRLNGQPIIIDGVDTGLTYNFTVVQPDIADECLYLVTKSPYYETWGHVLENAWDITVATGGDTSGSYGTLVGLQETYPDFQDALINSVGGTGDILQAVIDGDESTFGFFVMRPDPSSATFKTIAEHELTMVPVVDFDLEGKYEFNNLKVEQGGILSDPVYHDTACTQVQLITGSLANLDPNDRTYRRLEATIERASRTPAAEFKQAVMSKVTNWRDYLDNVKAVGQERLLVLMEDSKQAVGGAAN